MGNLRAVPGKPIVSTFVRHGAPSPELSDVAVSDCCKVQNIRIGPLWYLPLMVPCREVGQKLTMHGSATETNFCLFCGSELATVQVRRYHPGTQWLDDLLKNLQEQRSAAAREQTPKAPEIVSPGSTGGENP